MFFNTNWLTASLAGLWSSTGLLVSCAVLSHQINGFRDSDFMIWTILTIIFVVIPLQVAVIGRLPILAETMPFGDPFEQRRYLALVGRCLLWAISAIASGLLLWGMVQSSTPSNVQSCLPQAVGAMFWSLEVNRPGI